MKSKKISVICIGTGIFLLACGFAIEFAIFPAVLQDLVIANLRLEEGTEGWSNFCKSFYIFNKLQYVEITFCL